MKMLAVVAVVLAIIIGLALVCNAGTDQEKTAGSCCSLEDQANKTGETQPFLSERETTQLEQCLTWMDAMGMSDEALAMCAEMIDQGNQTMAGRSMGMMGGSMGSMCMMGMGR